MSSLSRELVELRSLLNQVLDYSSKSQDRFIPICILGSRTKFIDC
jgi:hypothetical protein